MAGSAVEDFALVRPLVPELELLVGEGLQAHAGPEDGLVQLLSGPSRPGCLAKDDHPAKLQRRQGPGKESGTNQLAAGRLTALVMDVGLVVDGSRLILELHHAGAVIPAPLVRVVLEQLHPVLGVHWDVWCTTVQRDREQRPHSDLLLGKLAEASHDGRANGMAADDKPTSTHGLPERLEGIVGKVPERGSQRLGLALVVPRPLVG
eukprot:CAMPEP_0113823912 /NCGR_PEP_ID=MMETSP0328-20130328/2979_1 /TAXON_ID=39455 /ORGANISM="Alexandrium minutum" /LENGTH=205 /DNA_ID=CAMNT_0000791851 /DNA_START=245 /DNA_END=862 /DNA_ORIENTATION=- /assembly_acc=CAM_ASM_000350